MRPGSVRFYHAGVVLAARAATPGIVAELEDGGQLELSLADFPPSWLEALLAVEDPAFYTHGGLDLATPGAGLFPTYR